MILAATTMNMQIFQVKSNRRTPTTGSLLLASPLLHDYHFARTVILTVTHSEEESMGLIINKNFRYRLYLNQLIPELAEGSVIPIYKGGPVERNTIFFIHTLADLEGAFDLKNGLYLNGNFEALQAYILEGNPIAEKMRFFAGYAGWGKGQLTDEIAEDSWIVSSPDGKQLLETPPNQMWEYCMSELGDPYRLWAKYPLYPSFN